MATKNVILGTVPKSRGRYTEGDTTTKWYYDNILEYKGSSFRCISEASTGITGAPATYNANTHTLVPNAGWEFFVDTTGALDVEERLVENEEKLFKLETNVGRIIDLDGFEEKILYPNGSTWLNNSNYRGKFISCKAGIVYTIVANNEFPSDFTFVKEIGTPNSTVKYATGYSNVVSIPVNERKNISVPEDAAYLYVATLAGANKNRTPEIRIKGLLDDVSILTDNVNNLTNRVEKIGGYYSYQENKGITVGSQYEGTLYEVELKSDNEYYIKTSADNQTVADYGSLNFYDTNKVSLGHIVLEFNGKNQVYKPATDIKYCKLIVASNKIKSNGDVTIVITSAGEISNIKAQIDRSISEIHDEVNNQIDSIEGQYIEGICDGISVGTSQYEGPLIAYKVYKDIQYVLKSTSNKSNIARYGGVIFYDLDKKVITTITGVEFNMSEYYVKLDKDAYYWKLNIVSSNIKESGSITLSLRRNGTLNSFDGCSLYGEIQQKTMRVAYSTLGLTNINSIEQFLSAKHLGFDAQKADMELTKDKKIVLCHDRGLTLDATGGSVAFDENNYSPISDMTRNKYVATEYHDYPNSPYNARQGYIAKHTDLDSFLYICKSKGIVPYLTLRQFAVDDTLKELSATLKKFGLQNRCIVSLFGEYGTEGTPTKFEAMMKVREILPNVVIINVLEQNRVLTEDIVDECKKVGMCIPMLFCTQWSCVENSLSAITYAQNNGILWGGYSGYGDSNFHHRLEQIGCSIMQVTVPCLDYNPQRYRLNYRVKDDGVTMEIYSPFSALLKYTADIEMDETKKIVTISNIKYTQSALDIPDAIPNCWFYCLPSYFELSSPGTARVIDNYKIQITLDNSLYAGAFRWIDIII